MIHITDPDVRQKIALVESDEWLQHNAQWERDAGLKTEDVSVANAFRLYQARKPLRQGQDPNSTTIYGAKIYGLCGWNRYFVTYTGEVVFSESHGLSSVSKAEAAGFRIWR